MITGRSPFPFAAIVGQERLKLGLVLNAIDPGIGGLLIRGPKGTGKSTAVYALASLLPDQQVVRDCPYGCSLEMESFLCADCRSRVEQGETLPQVARRVRVVALPLSASEDRVVGSVDMDRLLTQGQKAFRPGLLAEANQNFLYVDEINLLPDHITDDILDASASGWHTVEREGFSLTHPARFMLVGTMNPEEGDLRPQLLDRLPLSVMVETIRDVSQRVEITRRNLSFSADPGEFARQYEQADAQIHLDILAARMTLSDVGLPVYQLESVADMCVALKVDGQRPEMAIVRAATAIAAYRKHNLIDEVDLKEACELALAHRTRDGGFESPATHDEIADSLDRALQKFEGKKEAGTPIRFAAQKRDGVKKN